MGNFFVYDPEGRRFVDHFETEKQALEYAEECILSYLDDGWNEDVVHIAVGKITHRPKKCNVIERPDILDEDNYAEDGTYWPEEWDYVCGYEMTVIDD